MKKVKEPVSKIKAVKNRPPVVTIMGHVDHGKTSLLDAIRETDIAGGEFGGITQHISAYQVSVKPKGAKEAKVITFIDTPGHAAFTEMRSRGGKVADIIILVVAADDGVMPQTKEAISHAKAAGVPMIVAINKIDVAGANVDNVKKQLAEENVLVEDWGGDIVSVPVSAKEKTNLPDLLEMILLVAEMQDLKDEPNASFEGLIIESKLDRKKGVLATVLVRKGTLKIGDTVYVGDKEVRVKAMTDYKGLPIDKAIPSQPVSVMGFPEVPPTGAIISKEKVVEAVKIPEKITLVDFKKEDETGELKYLNLVLKTDVAGSLEALQAALSKLETEKVKIVFLHAATGDVTDSDVLLASAGGGIVIAFNVRVSTDITYLAKDRGVEVRNYSIIYEAIEDVEKAIEGILTEKPKEKVEGEAEILKLFPLPSGDVIFGAKVLDGRVREGDKVKIVRIDVEEPIGKGVVKKIKQKKEELNEVKTGKECGILIKPDIEVKVGDIIAVL
ncbi:translation initiation factor IF-2 [candidate division WWE3 bacterium CG08_land_8_20_14_0_20_41_15]|uniref:Translation initiation factor IF-2 n=1 Tax=candidate division WWE3 bacterium CG08_land_8_20_14_0_20_41_15 TaxID=1975086 RepID=A0A2H0XCR2_UNCKA|nr:MAG: translation initiation factor IF-2 [candidate division WWE3 bacterium CG08_land_8_20_14_0_20_41_15]